MVMPYTTSFPVLAHRIQAQPTPLISTTKNTTKSSLAINHGFSRHQIKEFNKKNDTFTDQIGLQLHKLISWANDLLNLHGIQSISGDLRLAFADSVILIRLVEVLTNETVHGVTRAPVTKFQKERNLVKCLDFLTKKGVLVITDIKAQDLINGVQRSVFQLLNAIKMYSDSCKLTNGYPIEKTIQKQNQTTNNNNNSQTSGTAALYGQLPDVTANNLPTKQKEASKSSYRERLEKAHEMKRGNRKIVHLISSIPANELVQVENSISLSDYRIATASTLQPSSCGVMNTRKIFSASKHSSITPGPFHSPVKQMVDVRENSFTPIKQTIVSNKVAVPPHHLLPKPYFIPKSYDNETFDMDEDNLSSISSCQTASLLFINSKGKVAESKSYELHALPGTVATDNGSDLLSINEESLTKLPTQEKENGSDTLSENEKALLNYESVQSSSPVNVATRCSPALGTYTPCYPIGSQASLCLVEPMQQNKLESQEISMNGIYFPQVAVPPDLLTIKPLHQQISLQQLANKKTNANGIYDSDTATSIRSDGGRYDSVSEEQLYDTTKSVQGLQRNVQQLQNMYHEIMRLLGVEHKYSPFKNVGIDELAKTTTHSHQHSRQGRAMTARDFKSINRRLTKVETHVVTLAKSVMQLSTEVSQVHDIITNKLTQNSLNSAVTCNVRNIHPSLRYLRYPLSMRKLEWFFGEKLPFLRNFLQDLGFTYVADILERHNITLSEFSCMSEDSLQQLGVPVGPCHLILQEFERLQALC